MADRLRCAFMGSSKECALNLTSSLPPPHMTYPRVWRICLAMPGGRREKQKKLGWLPGSRQRELERSERKAPGKSRLWTTATRRAFIEFVLGVFSEAPEGKIGKSRRRIHCPNGTTLRSLRGGVEKLEWETLREQTGNKGKIQEFANRGACLGEEF